MFADALKVFMENFPPKQDFSESELQLTTEELMRSFENHGVFELEVQTMYQQLEAAGYVYKAFDEDDRIVFKWLL
jgi:hypothetical protein